MADKNRKLPGHKWRLVDKVVLDTRRAFLYACAKCMQETLDGEPFGPNLMECK